MKNKFEEIKIEMRIFGIRICGVGKYDNLMLAPFFHLSKSPFLAIFSLFLSSLFTNCQKLDILQTDKHTIYWIHVKEDKSTSSGQSFLALFLRALPWQF
jgi:hypothetical protein